LIDYQYYIVSFNAQIDFLLH